MSRESDTCAHCGSSQWYCEASITVMRAGNEWDYAYFKCKECGEYTLETTIDESMTDEISSWRVPVNSSGAEEAIAEIRRCPAAHKKGCDCPVHQRYW